MKLSPRNTLLATAGLLGSLAASPVIYAHDINSGLTSGNGASAVDVYRVNCKADPAVSAGAIPHRLKAAIRDKSAAGGAMSLTIFKDGLATSVSDLKAGDLVQSSYVQLNSGSGDYWLFISHTQAAGDNYYVEYHCEAENGAHAGTALLQTQNK